VAWYTEPMRCPTAWYREFLPCKALQGDVYVLFSFVPGPAPARSPRPMLREVAFDGAPLCAPQFADGHVSLSFDLGLVCDSCGRWHVDSQAARGTIIGPMGAVGRTDRVDLPSTVGAFLRPARAADFLRIPISDLTDRTAAIDDVWGPCGLRLSSELCDLDEAARIDRLEVALLTHLAGSRPRTAGLDVDRLAASVLRQKGHVTVEAMADSAGVSRQHLTRAFRDRIGIAPKLYGRLARFQSGLIYAGSCTRIDWAGAALDLGYADQSHMIAEFREFGGLTPQMLASRDWFHPFIERTRPIAHTAPRDAP
jgi:AraC-like DNA-binding protein